MKLILYTGVKCPKCPGARKVVREVANELGWKEGVDFVEKIVDGSNLRKENLSNVVEIEGEKFYVVKDASEIKETPAAVINDDVMIEALTYQIASTPSIVINGEAVFIGEVPDRERLLDEIKKRVSG